MAPAYRALRLGVLQCAAAGLLVGCGAGAGPGGPAAATGPAPAGSPTPAVVAAGTQTPGSAWRYTLVHTELQRTIPRDGQFGIPIEAEGMWLLAEVQVENAGDRAQIVHGKDFQIRDGKGRIIPADEIGSATYSLRNRFARFGGEFRPGMRAPLGVVFDIDPDAAPLQLYLPQVPGAITLAP